MRFIQFPFGLTIKVFLVSFLLFMLYPSHSISQNRIEDAERTIKAHFDQMITYSEDKEKMFSINRKIVSAFRKILVDSESVTYSFDSLQYIKVLHSPDGKVKVLTWNIALQNGTHKYFGFVQQHNQQDNSIELHFLDDLFDLTIQDNKSVCSDTNWYGAIYIQIIPVQVDHKTYYTLLGVDMNDLFTTKKIIDIMYFTSDGIRFGYPLFSDGKYRVNRVVFEYSAQVSMNLTYSKSMRMILFDHLAPSDPDFAGQYIHYGPDSSVDGFKFEEERWIYMPDLDVNRIK